MEVVKKSETKNHTESDSKREGVKEHVMKNGLGSSSRPPPVPEEEKKNRPFDSEEVCLKRRLESAEKELRKSKKQIKELRAEVASAKKERQEIQSTVSSLYVQVKYWNSWLGKNFSRQMPSAEQDDKSDEIKEEPKVDEKLTSNIDKLEENKMQKDNLGDSKSNQLSPEAAADVDRQNEEIEYHVTQENEKGSNQESSVADMLKNTAENAFVNTGMTYDERTGLYYDWNTHMYYDPSTSLYYDNDNGIYYYYDNEKQNYVFYSQVNIKETGPTSPAVKSEKSEGELSSTDDDDDNVTGKVPCIRAIVTASNSLKPGSLYLITCKGATAGRDKKHLLNIPDIEASKDHAEIIYNETGHQFCLKDSGSINGTFINHERLSEPKVPSEWLTIKHKDYLKIGSTVLLLHVHFGNDTCDECEPGQVQALIASNEKAEEASNGLSCEAVRKKQLKGLKQKYMIKGDGLREALDPVSSGKYKDRAYKRRKTVGSDTLRSERPVAPAKASVTKKISNENKGHQMMQKMGWKSGDGLGKKNSGITEPINVVIREQNKGLGTGLSKSIDEVGGKSANHKWKRAKQRYDDIVSREQTGSAGDQQLPLDEF